MKPMDPSSVDAIAVDTVAGDKPSPLPATDQSDTLRLLAFDRSAVPGAIVWEGDLVDGAHWQDRNGENWLLVSEVFQGEISDKSLVAKFFASCHRTASGAVSTAWEIKEFNQDYFSIPQYVSKSLKITDLDHDGFAESLLIYEIEPDGTAPTACKLMLHVRDKKYAIRGQLAGEEEERGKVETKVFDPAFKEIAPLFKDYASRQWDAYQKAYYLNWDPH